MFIVLREGNLEIFKKTRDMKNPVKPMNNPKTHYPNTHPENKSGFLPALLAVDQQHDDKKDFNIYILLHYNS